MDPINAKDIDALHEAYLIEQVKDVPPALVEAINTLLIEKYNHGTTTVLHFNDIARRATLLDNTLHCRVSDFDIPMLYAQYGWDVTVVERDAVHKSFEFRK